MTLKDLNIGETAVVGTVGGEGALRQHFLDMGLIPGEEVTLVKFAPMGDPMELSIHGYELTLRLDDAARIGVTLAKAPAVKKAAARVNAKSSVFFISSCGKKCGVYNAFIVFPMPFPEGIAGRRVSMKMHICLQR